MKRSLAVVLILILLFTLCSCSMLYEHINNAVGSFSIGYSRHLKDAFLTNYNWDGTVDGKCIVIPENYNNVPITGLGGYCGRGVPSPFVVSPTVEAQKILCPNATSWSYTNDSGNIEYVNTEYLQFQLHISNNIKELNNVSIDRILLAQYEDDGETKYNAYIFTYYVTCDEDNKTFYSMDGKLYYREDNALVEGIIYEDFDLNEHN